MGDIKPNKYDKRYEIRFAYISDIDRIMAFIENHWKKNHILACDRSFFEYEFLNGERVNFLIAIDKNTGEIEAIQGFLPCSAWKKENKRDYWGSIWKVIPNHKNIPLLGIELDERLNKMLDARMSLGCGMNPNTSLPIAEEFFECKTGKMSHYYKLGNVGEFKVAVVRDFCNKPHMVCPKRISVKKYESFDELSREFCVDDIEAIPYKDSWYVNKRFFNHPIYKYNVYGVLENGVTKSIIVMREILCNGARILRVVDYIGEYKLIAYLGDFFQNLLDNEAYEYIDFYEFGVSGEFFESAGLRLKDGDYNIIPNYFEPFIQQNVDIYVSYKYDGTTFFKADSDQDRPNNIKRQ